MISQCLQFAEHLRYHPSIDNFESAMDGGRCGLGTTDPRTTRLFVWIDRLREVYDRLCGEVWWYTQGRLRPRQPPAPSPISSLLDCAMRPSSGGGGGESAVAAAQGYYHLQLIHAQFTVPAPPGVELTVGLNKINGRTVTLVHFPNRAQHQCLLRRLAGRDYDVLLETQEPDHGPF
ncbi:unnamed protein product [Schistocephalus solidus]|uniref:Uncharacterized protein n=1 Tax=Schistocephalus solidus TaxID=70667 RepID=A0A183SJS8_SCHSO|nr:unnamed protein product [Schistocephalus solidus]